jgi:hypothetical protein
MVVPPLYKKCHIYGSRILTRQHFDTSAFFGVPPPQNFYTYLRFQNSDSRTKLKKCIVTAVISLENVLLEMRTMYQNSDFATDLAGYSADIRYQI